MASSKAPNASLQRGLEIFNEVDRISTLPDSVLCFILSFLETKESVQTCILSKRWKFLWTNVPCLYFSPFSYREAEQERFKKFVTMALLLHKYQSLNEFHLSWEDGADPFNVTTWLSTAIVRNVKVLDISVVCNEINNFIALPGSLFSCKSLESLKLDGDLSVLVPSFVSLPRLECLNLTGVLFECDESVPKFLQGCPVLKSLYIIRNRYDNVVVFKVSSPTLRHLEIEAFDFDYSTLPTDYVHKLEINAPLLEYLYIVDYESEDYTFQSLTSLLELHLYKDEPTVDVEISVCDGWVDKLIRALHGLKVLTLGFNVFISNFPEAKLLSLTKLTVNTPFWYWEDLLRVLKILVNLEIFEFRDTHFYSAIDETLENVVPGCFSSSLQRISIADFYGTKGTLGMIKYFLKHGGLLKQVGLHLSTDIDDSKRYDILKKISTFSRKSSVCEVHFLDQFD